MGQYHSTELPTAHEAAQMARREPDNKQAKLLDECARKIIKSAKAGVLETACSPRLDNASVNKIRAKGHQVTYVDDDPDWPYDNVSFYNVSWVKAAGAVNKE